MVNDRIKVLWKQAESHTTTTGELRDRFAELIVQECVAKLFAMDDAVNGNHNYYRHAAVQIKEHFGVE